MRGLHDLLRDFVEFRRHGVGQRILQPVDRAGLHGEIDFLEGERRRIGAERIAEELPGFRARHAQLQARHIGRRLDVLRLRAG